MKRKRSLTVRPKDCFLEIVEKTHLYLHEPKQQGPKMFTDRLDNSFVAQKVRGI